MKSYKNIKANKSSIDINESTEGETIEQKMERIMHNKEPIKDGAPIIFTERKEGVLSAYNIKTDRFEIACEAMDSISKQKIANREGKIIEMNKEKSEKTESTDGTN